MDGAGPTDAQAALEAMGLRVIELEPAARPARAAPIRGHDFLAFNQQLAQLTAAGLPVERGLRLIAQEMRPRRLAETVRQVADALHRGASLPEAFEQHRKQFPPLYGRLVEAGVRSGQLPAVLLNLGRHLELVHRLRWVLWRTLSYPLLVLAMMMLVLSMLGMVVVPVFEQTVLDQRSGSLFWGDPSFAADVPLTTRIVFAVAEWMPTMGLGLLGLIALLLLVWAAARAAGREQAVIDHVALPLPLVGPVLRKNLVARWCDALRVAVEAGLDLPAAIGMAGDVVRSPRLRADGERLITALEAGRSIQEHDQLDVLLATVPATIEFGSARHDLPALLANLSAMYEEQAEQRITAIHALLTPVLLVVLAVLMGYVITGMFLPLARLLQSIM